MINKTLLKNDLKRYKFSIIIWTGVFVWLTVLSIALFIPTRNIMQKTLESTENGSNAVFDALSLFGSPMQYFLTSILPDMGMFVGVIAAIFGVMAWAREEKSNTADFLVQAPISRSDIWTTKLVAITISNLIITTSFSIIGIGGSFLLTAITGEKLIGGEILAVLLSCIELIIMELVISYLIFSLSFFTKKAMSTGLSIGLGVASYISLLVVSLLSSLLDGVSKTFAGIVYILSPLSVFMISDNTSVCMGEKVPVSFWWGIASAVVWILASIVMLVLSKKKFNKRDLCV